MIYSSSWTDIRDQIARLGDFIAIPATAAFADASVREKLSWAETIARQPRNRWPSAMNTIVVQGAVDAGCHRACAADSDRAQPRQSRPALDLGRHGPGTSRGSRCRSPTKS